MSGGQTQRQVQLISDFRPDIIMVTPSYMLAIAEEFARRAWIRARPRCASASSARSRGRRRCATEIETRFGIDALDIYGLSEVMGPGVASECLETKDGPVIWEDHF